MRRAAAGAEYSARLGGVARFAVAHKTVVIGAWLGMAIVLALLFPQLETVVRQQSVDSIPADLASFQTLDRMGYAFGEKGAKTTVVVALVKDLLADPVTARQAVSEDGKAWYLPVGIAGTLGGPLVAAGGGDMSASPGRSYARGDVGKPVEVLW